MYTKEEEDFIKYWEANRHIKKKLSRKLMIGLPAGALIFIAILISFFSGWYKRANMVVNADPGLLITILIAGIIIVAFYEIYASKHKWDINEKNYRQLISRKK